MNEHPDIRIRSFQIPSDGRINLFGRPWGHRLSRYGGQRAELQFEEGALAKVTLQRPRRVVWSAVRAPQVIDLATGQSLGPWNRRAGAAFLKRYPNVLVRHLPLDTGGGFKVFGQETREFTAHASQLVELTFQDGQIVREVLEHPRRVLWDLTKQPRVFELETEHGLGFLPDRTFPSFLEEHPNIRVTNFKVPADGSITIFGSPWKKLPRARGKSVELVFRNGKLERLIQEKPRRLILWEAASEPLFYDLSSGEPLTASLQMSRGFLRVHPNLRIRRLRLGSRGPLHVFRKTWWWFKAQGGQTVEVLFRDGQLNHVTLEETGDVLFDAAIRPQMINLSTGQSLGVLPMKPTLKLLKEYPELRVVSFRLDGTGRLYLGRPWLTFPSHPNAAVDVDFSSGALKRVMLQDTRQILW